MLHRSVAGLAAFAALAVMPSTSSAATAGPVQFGLIQYDQPGSDLPADKDKLNREFVTLVNTGRATVSLGGWTLRDETRRSDHIYTFRKGFRLAPGRSVRVHTGTGTDAAGDVYWGRTGTSGVAYIWNNIDRYSNGDTAFLHNDRGTLVDCRVWRRGTGTRKCG